jgi:hypothetical protein
VFYMASPTSQLVEANQALAPSLPGWTLFGFATLGAFALYFKLKGDGRPVIEFLRFLFPSWRSPLVPLIEAVLFSVLGGALAYGIVQPSTVVQAISAGLGWTGLFSAVGAPNPNASANPAAPNDKPDLAVAPTGGSRDVDAALLHQDKEPSSHG